MRQRLFVTTIAVALAAMAINVATASTVAPVSQSIPSGTPTVFTSPLPSASPSPMSRP